AAFLAACPSAAAAGPEELDTVTPTATPATAIAAAAAADNFRFTTGFLQQSLEVSARGVLRTRSPIPRRLRRKSACNRQQPQGRQSKSPVNTRRPTLLARVVAAKLDDVDGPSLPTDSET